MEKIRKIYERKAKENADIINKNKRKLLQTAYIRAFIFLATAAIAWFVFRQDYIIGSAVILTGLSLFIFFVKKTQQYSDKIEFHKKLKEINDNELKALNYDFSFSETGEEYIDSAHPYSFDLDIFGENSIYQAINRCCSEVGSDRLADLLKKTLKKENDIIQRQEAIQNLSEKLEWRQNFCAAGKISIKKNQDKWFRYKKNNEKYNRNLQEINEWINRKNYFFGKKIYKYGLKILPLISLILIILGITGIFGIALIINFGIASLIFTSLKIKKINEIHKEVNSKIIILQKYSKLIEYIENEIFDSLLLQKEQIKVSSEKETAAIHLNKLVKLISALDNRMNIIFAIFANGLFLWDIYHVYKIEQWIASYGKKLPIWFDCIATFDALSSFANFRYNNPDFTFPNPEETAFRFSIKEGGHPLINREQRIDNDFCIENKGGITIITGANMAGKSTFLRTMGVNLLLACCGSVVCAKKLKFKPLELHTSIRNNDSLQKNESYFYAELKRLQSIILRLKKGEELFIIIDEMLRGTNSKDKHYGSEAYIKQLIKMNTIGLLATHDIALGKMTDKYPVINNKCFEVDIKNEQLKFDYKLRDGISQKLNASFLMSKMNIIDKNNSLNG